MSALDWALAAGMLAWCAGVIAVWIVAGFYIWTWIGDLSWLKFASLAVFVLPLRAILWVWLSDPVDDADDLRL